jgi:membrane-associated phospholipid phosphatase
MHQPRSSLLVPDRDRLFDQLLLVAAIASALTVLCIFTIDQPFARWLATRDTWPAVWDHGIDALEYAALIAPWKLAGACVLAGGVVLSLAVPPWRRFAPAWMLVGLTHLLARNVMMWGKFATGRLRPPEWLAHPGDTFFRDGGYSFPSGHVMLFASLALPIAIVWPRSRVPMFAIIAFPMIARVAVNAHFLSDVTGGLALTAGITWLCARAVDRASRWPIRPASRR